MKISLVEYFVVSTISCVIFTSCLSKNQNQEIFLINDFCKCIEFKEKSYEYDSCKMILSESLDSLTLDQKSKKLQEINKIVKETCPQSIKLIKGEYLDSFSLIDSLRSSFNKDACNLMLHEEHLFYINNKERTEVLIKNGKWIELDGGFKTELSFHKLDSCSFDLVFLESSNPIKKNYSEFGDLYKYEIIEKFPAYYLAQYSRNGKKYLVKFYIPLKIR